MTKEILTALAGFAFVSSITPGPNNLMLMTSGVNFGFRRTVPHMLGVGLGFMFMIVLVGLGLAQIFEAYPIAHQVLTVFSVAYLLWLAWKIAHAAAPEKGAGEGAKSKPMSFTQAALFQWVNPKAWTMALAAVTLYAPDRSAATIVQIAIVFGLINLPSVSSWTVLGQQASRWLSTPAKLRVFNWSMAVLLVLSLVPLVKDMV